MAKHQESFVEIHGRVMKHLHKMAPHDPVFKVVALAKKVGKDPRVVRLHLEVAQLHGEGKFLDRTKQVFAMKEAIEDLAKELLENDPAVAMSYAAGALSLKSEASSVRAG